MLSKNNLDRNQNTHMTEADKPGTAAATIAREIIIEVQRMMCQIIRFRSRLLMDVE